MYDPKSKKAEEFIDDAEIKETLRYAAENRNNIPLIESILEKAARLGGLSHREAAVLLECGDPASIEKIYALAREVKRRNYGNRIVMFAPLYLSNYCVNECRYLSLIHISEPTRQAEISYAVFCLKKKKKTK